MDSQRFTVRTGEGAASLAALRCCYDANNEIMLLEVVGSGQLCKAVLGALCSGNWRGRLDLGGFYGKLRRSEEGYRTWRHQLCPTDWHFLFAAKDQRLLMAEDALEGKLRGPRFTTPFLRPWLPYLKSKLESAGLLRALDGFNPCGYVLNAGTPDLDQIVSEGVKRGELRLEDA